MPLPVVTDTYLVRLRWESSAGQRPAYNNLYFVDQAGTQGAADLGADFVGNLTAGMWTVVSNTAGIKAITVTPLDGVSATYNETGFTPGNANVSGGGGSDPILQGACVISQQTAKRGKSYRGRIYLPFVGETNQANGILTPANVTTMQAAWTTFLGAMAADGWPWTVVSEKLQTEEEVFACTVRPNLLTQRRRARR